MSRSGCLFVVNSFYWFWKFGRTFNRKRSKLVCRQWKCRRTSTATWENWRGILGVTWETLYSSRKLRGTENDLLNLTWSAYCLQKYITTGTKIWRIFVLSFVCFLFFFLFRSDVTEFSHILECLYSKNSTLRKHWKSMNKKNINSCGNPRCFNLSSWHILTIFFSQDVRVFSVNHWLNFMLEITINWKRSISGNSFVS